MEQLTAKQVERLKKLTPEQLWRLAKRLDSRGSMAWNTGKQEEAVKLLRRGRSIKQLSFDTRKTAGFLEDSADYIKRNWDYGKYLTKHKFYVFKAGRQLGVPTMALTIHDWSKMSPTAWGSYRDWFYDKERGRLGDQSLKPQFREAVDYHYRTNSHGHHWYKSQTPMEQVPTEYRLESLADWYGVYAANWMGPEQKLTFKEWYMKHREKLPLDPITKHLADQKIMYGL